MKQKRASVILSLLISVTTAISFFSCNNNEEKKDINSGNYFSSESSEFSCSHNWIEASCTSPNMCNICGETSGSPLGHTTETGICSRCGKNFVYQTIRNYIDANSLTEEHTCLLYDSLVTLIAHYDPSTENITLAINESDTYIEIVLIEGKSQFAWLGKSNTYTMKGTEEYSSITKEINALHYFYTDAQDNTKVTLNEICAISLKLLLYSINDNFKTIEISVADLGFENF